MDELRTFFRSLAALRLSDAGRHDAALAALGSARSSLGPILSFRAQVPAENLAGDAGDALEGWRLYYSARYASAVPKLVRGVSSGLPWIEAWCALGLSKVATDTGRWRTAAGWCSVATALARRYELLELMAEISGARGEVLLRAGRPVPAAEAFSLDLSLLPVGSRFRGRVLCYRAHAFARLGEAGWPAAELAYRVAAHTPGEATAGYARAGLALLGAASGRPSLVEEACRPPVEPNPIAEYWCRVAQARVASSAGAPASELLLEAGRRLPSEYPYERRWLSALGASMGAPSSVELPADPADLSPEVPAPEDSVTWRQVTSFDRGADDDTLPDQGFGDGWLEGDLWVARERFMP